MQAELSKAESAANEQVQIVVALSEAEITNARRRSGLSACAVFGACILWFLMLGKLQAATDGIPWYITSATIAVVFALVVTKRRVEQFRVRQLGREPLSLFETWAIAYLAAAVLLYAWVLLHAMLPEPTERKPVQIVDIELVSPQDFADRESPLPGTEEQPELRKRQSDSITSQGTFAPQKVLPKRVPKAIPTPQTPMLKVVPTKSSEVTDETPTKMLFVKPIQLPAAVKEQPLFEEITPPEMVEMIENEGTTNATTVFQAGGKSVGGKGAANDLSAYIKELHRRIKSAWSPPRGQSRRAEILFRIKKDGRLAFIKVRATSGDPETDEAAMRAVTAAVRLDALPASSQLPYLDVQYSFNYIADEIKEMTPAKAPE